MKAPASPATGLLYAALAFALFITCWKAYTILLGAIGLLVLARRGWDWCRAGLLFVLACLLLTDVEKGEPQPEYGYGNA